MKKLLTFVVLVFASVGMVSVANPVMSTVSAEGPNCENRFLTFPPWYHHLTKGADCKLKSPADIDSDATKGITGYISIIILNVLEIMLQLVAYVSAGFIIWGGYMYLISTGSSDRITSGKKMIQNAIIGLVISLVAVFAVSFIAGRIGI
jgi:hypothetical protein